MNLLKLLKIKKIFISEYFLFYIFVISLFENKKIKILFIEIERDY
jgi:hypothetical protein